MNQFSSLHLLDRSISDLAPFFVPKYICTNYQLYHFNEGHSQRGLKIIAIPKNKKLRTLTIQKYTDIISPEQAQHSYNSIQCLSRQCMSRRKNLLICAYPDPDSNLDENGAFITTFYTINAVNHEVTLSKEIRRKTVFRPKDIKSIACQLLEQVYELSVHKLYQSAIRPGNIAFERKRGSVTATLINYGEAALNVDPVDMCESKFRSPEQVGKFVDVGTASDVYSVGVLILQLLIGKTIFPGHDDLTLLEAMAEYAGVLNEATSNFDDFIRRVAEKAPSPNTRDVEYMLGLLRPHIFENMERHALEWSEITLLVSLAKDCMQFLPCDRISASDALHRYFGVDCTWLYSSSTELSTNYTTEAIDEMADEDERMEELCIEIYSMLKQHSVINESDL